MELILRKFSTGSWLKSFPGPMWDLVSRSTHSHHSARVEMGVSLKLTAIVENACRRKMLADYEASDVSRCCLDCCHDPGNGLIKQSMQGYFSAKVMSLWGTDAVCTRGLQGLRLLGSRLDLARPSRGRISAACACSLSAGAPYLWQEHRAHNK